MYAPSEELIALLLLLTSTGLARAQAPSITSQPISLNAGRGTDPRFQVFCTGTAPLKCQWARNGVAIEGATMSSLVLSNVQSSQAGSYSVTVTNTLGGRTSSNALLVVGNIAIWGLGSVPIQASLPLNFTNARAISAGPKHMLAIGESREVVAWGTPGYSAATNVPGHIADARSISAGLDTSFAIDSTGLLQGWGADGVPTNVPGTLTNAVMVSAGSGYAVALRENGDLTAWGALMTPTNTPAGLLDYTRISAAEGYAMATLSDGIAASWSGSGWPPFAAFLSSVTNAILVSSGYDHCLVLNRDGTVTAAGNNSRGQINIPVGLSNVVSVAAGNYTSFALTQDGSIKAWGETRNSITTLTNVVAVTTASSGSGSGYAAALMNDGAASITIQPANRKVHELDSTVLSVRAAGAGALSCQWFLNGSPISGETNCDLALSSVQMHHAGSYQAVVTNELGSATSAVAKVTVLIPKNVRVWGAPSVVARLPLGLTNVTSISVRSNNVLTLDDQGQVGTWGGAYSGATTGAAVVSDAKEVAAGLRYSLVLRTNGTVVALGITNLPSSLTNIIAISSGDTHALALNSGGKVIAWGDNNKGQTTVPANVSEVVAMAAGTEFSLALRRDGFLYGWGALGGSSVVVPPGLENVVGIAAGFSHALALRANGTLVAWGNNTSGKTNVPSEATNVIAIAAGRNHNLALRADGSLIAWGAPSEATTIPPALENIIAIACAETNSLAVIGVGTPVLMNDLPDVSLQAPARLDLSAMVAGQQPISYQWFWNGIPIVGATTANYTVSAMQYYNSGSYYYVASNALGSVTSRVAQVTVSPTRSMAAWGLNGCGQTDVPNGLWRGIKVSAGADHSLSLDQDGLITAWGNTNWGQCEVPASATNIIDIAAGHRFSVALRKDGSLLVWGGTNKVNNASVLPGVLRIPADAAPAQSLAVGAVHAVCLRRNGTVAAWGTTAGAWPMTSPALTNVAAVAAGWEHCVALRSNGTVYCWGPGGGLSSVTNTPADLAGVKAIAAGDYHTVALKSNGTVVAWGMDPDVVRVPVDLTNAMTIAAGPQRGMAVTADGRLVSWGLPQVDPEDWVDRSVPPGLTNILSLSLGHQHNLAITIDPRPCITQSPRSRSIPPGWPLTFSSTATGQEPLAYQWQFNGVDMENATNSLLSITNVTEAEYGHYRVVVSNLFGAVTSRVALLAKGNLLAWETRRAFLGDPEQRSWIPARASNSVSIALGYPHTLALREDGAVVAWGHLTAREVAGMRDVEGGRAIAAGGGSGLAISSSGVLSTWSSYYPPRSPEKLTEVVSAALSVQDAGVVCYQTGAVARWGTIDTNPPSNFTNIAQVYAVDYDGVLGIRYDGTLASWGVSLPWTNSANVVHAKFARLHPAYPKTLADGYVLLADGKIASLVWGGTVGTNCASASGVRADGTLGAPYPLTTVPRPLTNVVEAESAGSLNMVRFGDGSPNITIQPYSRTVEAWTPFTVAAFGSGNPPFAYQWQLNGQNISGATNASYTVQNPAFAALARYRCIITNALGAATSQVAQVSLTFPPPTLLAQPWTGGPQQEGFAFDIQKLSGKGPSVVYGSSNLVEWFTLCTNPPAQGSLLWQDPFSTNGHHRFYRVMEQRD